MKVMPSFLPMFYDTLRSSSQIHFAYAHSELFGNDFEKVPQTMDTYEVSWFIALIQLPKVEEQLFYQASDDIYQTQTLSLMTELWLTFIHEY